MHLAVIRLLNRLETRDTLQVETANHLPGFRINVASFAALLAATFQEEAQTVE
jgi:hypothetical protein